MMADDVANLEIVLNKELISNISALARFNNSVMFRTDLL